ncbi:apicoplast ribosomal protein S19, putative (apicoplast) [Plasmodium gallinaceum]|uniref:Apicoplast ribosomal protein S19, putative n=1 Tax=Plasmodium gallinaceum TaxID=5849 RepID=H7CDX1_PLAGA|nr:apicoplast ribosomal protein S19, putative [Plasmodium gallinaceum]BAL70741.1 small subunit ribosomal protein 19 [Plasmodium gallinaceum]CRG98230.1 apicoplast ribosomal protein S19, putative [Plasmodium gallinaceum]
MIKLYWLKISLNNKYIFKNLNKNNNKNIILKIYNKNIYIYKKLLNIYLKVYNGCKFIPIYINKYKLYKKIGNFIYTKFIKNNIKELILD